MGGAGPQPQVGEDFLDDVGLVNIPNLLKGNTLSCQFPHGFLHHPKQRSALFLSLFFEQGFPWCSAVKPDQRFARLTGGL